MWVYSQSSGKLFSPNGDVFLCYSGKGAGKNNPDMEHVKETGPLPRGMWVIVGPPVDTKTHGPAVLRLVPKGDTHGRAGFLIHGDSKSNPGNASRGCIIAGRAIRNAVWDSGDTDLKVIE